MATVLNNSGHHTMTVHSSIQKICIGMGIFFIFMGVMGIIMPGFMGLHLSMANNLIHLASGVLALWCGYSDVSSRAYNFCVAFGSIYGLLGVAGFILGEPGYPAVGFTRADENLMRVIPNVLEFGTMDHIAHLAVSVILLASAYMWKKDNRLVGSRTTVDAQGRTGVFGNDNRINSDRVDVFTEASDSTSTTQINPSDIDRFRKNSTDDINFEKRL